MSPHRGISDLPRDVLCAIVQHCCGDNIYRLKDLAAVSESFRSSVAMVSSTLAIADLRYTNVPGRESPKWRKSAEVKALLKQCPNLVGLLFFNHNCYSTLWFTKDFCHILHCLCILQMHHCRLSWDAILKLGQSLPNLQGLSLCNSDVRDFNHDDPWEGFPQLKLLRVDWMRDVTWQALEPFRSQLVYLSCHGCELIDDSICTGLDSCVALDLGHDEISDEGLETLLKPKGAPNLKLLMLNTKAGNLWSDGSWTPAMLEQVQRRGIKVIQSAGYGTNKSAVEDCLQEVLHDSPQLLKYAAMYVL